MASSLYEICLQGISVVVFNKTCARLGNAEYNYHAGFPAGVSHHRGNWPFVNTIPLCLGSFVSHLLLFIDNWELTHSAGITGGSMQNFKWWLQGLFPFFIVITSHLQRRPKNIYTCAGYAVLFGQILKISPGLMVYLLNVPFRWVYLPVRPIQGGGGGIIMKIFVLKFWGAYSLKDLNVPLNIAIWFFRKAYYFFFCGGGGLLFRIFIAEG